MIELLTYGALVVGDIQKIQHIGVGDIQMIEFVTYGALTLHSRRSRTTFVKTSIEQST